MRTATVMGTSQNNGFNKENINGLHPKRERESKAFFLLLTLLPRLPVVIKQAVLLKTIFLHISLFYFTINFLLDGCIIFS